jgi:hypothetical protein
MKRRIRQEFRVVVSPQTLIEILKSVKDARTEEHFQTRRQELEVMVNGGEAEFLRFPGSFAVFTVFGFQTPVEEPGPVDFEQWHRIAQHAKSCSELKNCQVQIPHDPMRYGINLPFIEAEEKAGVERHREHLTAMASKAFRFPPPSVWAQQIAAHQQFPVTEEHCERLADRLSAAYEYHKSTFSAVIGDPAYNLTKHDSDRMDYLQLFYLCDPALHILTEDAGIRNVCGASGQSSRILALNEF